MTDTARPTDELGARLIAAGLVPNEFILDLNSHLATPNRSELPWPWCAPSRAFMFPIAYDRPDADGRRSLRLLHPLMAAHPHVKHVEAVLGADCWTEPPRQSDIDQCAFWHGIDMLDAGKPRELLRSVEFTSAEYIAYGVEFVLGSRDGISIKDARTVLRLGGCAEPQDVGALLNVFSEPLVCADEKGVERWPVNTKVHGVDRITSAWATLIGLERGWFNYHGRHIGWTEAGRVRFEAGPDAVAVETSTAQMGFAF